MFGLREKFLSNMDLQDNKNNKRNWKIQIIAISCGICLVTDSAFKEEKNMRSHVLSAVAATIAGFDYGFQRRVAVVLTDIFLVIAFEIMNSTV